MQRPKPQFASWLIEQVETGQYSGLHYIEHKKFRVPWKHNSRKDCNDDDGKIFKAWAVASGKIYEFPDDKAKWKTNFRCALNNLKRQFKMIQDNSKNTDDPHKIYEIISTEGLQMQSSQEDYDSTPDIHYSPTEDFPSGNDLNLLNTIRELDISSNMEENGWGNGFIFQQTSPVLATYPVFSAPANNVEMILEQKSYMEPPPTQFNPPQHPPVEQVPPIELEISIFYRGREMLKNIVPCHFTHSLQLHYPQESRKPNVHHSICFPSPDNFIIDQKQIKYTKRILESVQRGLTLEVNEHGIFACRQDRCHVFSSTSDPTVALPYPQKLPPDTKVQVLSFDKYLNELKNFKENNGPSPEYTINMCFGEKFPDGKALERKLIIVKVVPLICRCFHEQAQREGASSLHSANISLQTSYNSLMDLINDFMQTMEGQENIPTQEHY
ncbi:unnamed protein product [Knipowitschia caucasica]|uniref:IRF tryptophan pentad repeat domain-containing protein n=1 Tax=Knipowitschia caucasica TaxID=637954 RepID=A0AAV2L424_KNICA